MLDLGLPDAQGLGAVRRVRAAAPHVPLVVLTGFDDEALATQALQEGAQDYLIKGQVETRGLMRALRYAVERSAMERAARAMALEMIHLARHDPLTGLPNRVLFNDRVGQAIVAATSLKQSRYCTWIWMASNTSTLWDMPHRRQASPIDRKAPGGLRPPLGHGQPARAAMNSSCSSRKWSNRKGRRSRPGGSCRQWQEPTLSISTNFTSRLLSRGK